MYMFSVFSAVYSLVHLHRIAALKPSPEVSALGHMVAELPELAHNRRPRAFMEGASPLQEACFLHQLESLCRDE